MLGATAALLCSRDELRIIGRVEEFQKPSSSVTWLIAELARKLATSSLLIEFFKFSWL